MEIFICQVETIFIFGLWWIWKGGILIFLGAILLYGVKNKKSSKHSEKILKNQEKYSMNNGENPSSNQWIVKKL